MRRRDSDDTRVDVRPFSSAAFKNVTKHTPAARGGRYSTTRKHTRSGMASPCFQPRWVAGFGYTATVACAAVLIVNFAQTVQGHPWFIYGGLAAP